MVSLEEFKKALGETANGMTEQELVDLNERCSKLSHALFDAWSAGLKHKASSPQQVKVLS